MSTESTLIYLNWLLARLRFRIIDACLLAYGSTRGRGPQGRRHTHLMRMFLRGVPYAEVEPRTRGHRLTPALWHVGYAMQMERSFALQEAQVEDQTLASTVRYALVNPTTKAEREQIIEWLDTKPEVK